MKNIVDEKLKFFYRVLMIAKTWGILKIVMFIPYELIYGLKFKVNTLFSINNYELDVLPDQKENSTEYARLIEVFKAHNIKYFFYFLK